MAHFYKNPRYLLPFILVVTLLFITCAYVYEVDKNLKSEQRAELLRIEIEQENKERAELDRLFNIYLDNFKADLKKAALIYKGSRKVLKEMLSPYNFETPEYTKENYDLFKRHIAPNLRSKSNEIVNIFKEYDDKINEEIKNIDSEIGQKFFSKWKEMNNKQLINYIEFFTKEEQRIQAYEDIIKFYYVHSNLFSFDIERNELIFDREEDQNKEKYLLDKIK